MYCSNDKVFKWKINKLLARQNRTNSPGHLKTVEKGKMGKAVYYSVTQSEAKKCTNLYVCLLSGTSPATSMLNG